MSIIVISDLHLSPDEPKGLDAFALIRQKWGENCTELYILGDFFEAWIGDDDDNDFIRAIVTELQAWQYSGVNLYFMPGNRDFLLGEQFAKRVRWIRLPDPYLADFYGVNVLLSHGDQLCTDDTAYQTWRKYAHSSWLQRLFLMLPLWLRRKMAHKARQESMNYVQSAELPKMDITFASALEWMQQANVSTLIHGHTHKPGYHMCYHAHRVLTRITLSDWHDGAHALVWEKDGVIQLL